MQQPIWRRNTWLILAFVLGVGAVMSISACAPGGAGTGTGTTPQGTGIGATPQGTGTATAPQSTVTATASQGTVNGLVVAGPTCPVERADQPCPPKPVPNRVVLIETAGGVLVTRVTTDQNGKFTVPLSPGTYNLQVAPGSSPFPVQRKSQQVTVVAGQTVEVQVMLDTGIR